MKNVLVLIGSIQPHEKSVSTKVLQAFMDAYKENHKDDAVEIVDVAEINNIAFTRTLMAGKLTENDGKVLENRQALLNKFMKADLIVLASPMWNYGLPGQVKEIIDTFAVAGTTFRYLDKPNANGSIIEALTTGKKLVFIQAMGGMNTGENDISYLQVKQLFGFIGVIDVSYIPIQATNIPGMSEEEKAITEVKALATTL